MIPFSMLIIRRIFRLHGDVVCICIYIYIYIKSFWAFFIFINFFYSCRPLCKIHKLLRTVSFFFCTSYVHKFFSLYYKRVHSFGKQLKVVGSISRCRELAQLWIGYERLWRPRTRKEKVDLLKRT